MDPFLEDAQASGGGFDPVSMLRAFWRRKWLLIIPFILCFSMAAVAIKIMTPIYFSAGQVRIIRQNTGTNLIQDTERRYGSSPKKVDMAAYNDMDLLLTSPEFLEKMVRDLNLHLALRQSQAQAGEEPMSEEQAVQKAARRLKSMLRIEQDGLHVFRIGIRDTDPERAYRMISHILEAFLAEYRASQVASRTSTRDFLEKQLTGYRANQAQAEKALTEFQSSMAAATLLDNPINARNLGNADSNLQHLRDRQRGSDRTEMARLRQEALTVVDPLPGVSRYRTDPAIKGLLRQMVDLSVSQALLAQTDGQVEQYNDNLAQLRIRLNTLIENKVAADYPNLGFLDRNRLSQYLYFSIFQDGMTQVTSKLSRWINEFRSFTAKQPEQSARLAELQDAVTQASDLVNNLEQEITQQNLNLKASQSEIGFQIKVRNKPSLPTSPIEPNKQKLLLMGFILSLAIGIGLAILAIMLDRSFTSVQDIERTLGLPVIGTLPVIQDDIFERKRKLKILRWVTIVLGILAIAAVGFLVVYPRLS